MPFTQHDAKYHMSPPHPDGYWEPVNYQGSTEEHFAAMGRLVAQCSRLESAGYVFLIETIKSEHDIGRALLGSPSLGDIMQTIRNLAVAQNWAAEDVEKFRLISEHVKYILSIRNIVAHQTIAVRPDWIRFQRGQGGKLTKDYRTLIYPVKIGELNNLSNFIEIVFHMAAAIASFNPNSGFVGSFDKYYAESIAFIAANDLPEPPESRRNRLSQTFL